MYGDRRRSAWASRPAESNVNWDSQGIAFTNTLGSRMDARRKLESAETGAVRLEVWPRRQCIQRRSAGMPGASSRPCKAAPQSQSARRPWQGRPWSRRARVPERLVRHQADRLRGSSFWASAVMPAICWRTSISAPVSIGPTRQRPNDIPVPSPAVAPIGFRGGLVLFGRGDLECRDGLLGRVLSRRRRGGFHFGQLRRLCDLEGADLFRRRGSRAAAGLRHRPLKRASGAGAFGLRRVGLRWIATSRFSVAARLKRISPRSNRTGPDRPLRCVIGPDPPSWVDLAPSLPGH